MAALRERPSSRLCADCADDTNHKDHDHDDHERATQLSHERGRPPPPTRCSRTTCTRSTLALAPRARLCARRRGSARRPKIIQDQDHRQAAASPPPRASPFRSPRPALLCPAHSSPATASRRLDHRSRAVPSHVLAFAHLPTLRRTRKVHCRTYRQTHIRPHCVKSSDTPIWACERLILLFQFGTNGDDTARLGEWVTHTLRLRLCMEEAWVTHASPYI